MQTEGQPFFWTEKQAAERLGVPASTLRKRRFFRDPAGPPFTKMGRAVRYPVAKCLAWAEAQAEGNQS
jgi:hypothetical protein